MTGGDAGCCARAASGHTTAAPLRSLMNARRLMRLPKSEDDSLSHQAALLCITANSDARLLVWVIRVDWASDESPLVPRFRTSWAHSSYDAKCHSDMAGAKVSAYSRRRLQWLNVRSLL